MTYQDLVYKITSKQAIKSVPEKDLNPAKKSMMVQDILFGILATNEKDLFKNNIELFKKEIYNKLTVLENAPIGNTFGFLVIDSEILKLLLENFPEFKIYYLADESELEAAKSLKKEYLNFERFFIVSDKRRDFVNRTDFVITVNFELDMAFENQIKSKNIMIIPIRFMDIDMLTQPYKQILPDASGWKYNSGSGKWFKSWGWDGYQELSSWGGDDWWQNS